MPFIDCKITKKLTDEQKEKIKSGLGAAISNMHKPESYLMVGICDGYDLFFAGKKITKRRICRYPRVRRGKPAGLQQDDRRCLPHFKR